MIVKEAGHIYELSSLDNGDPQTLIFVKRDSPSYKYPGNKGNHGGTISQEVLRALIDRSEYVNNQQPCAETEAVTGLLKTALFLLESRNAKKKDLDFNPATLDFVRQAAICDKCGHVGCEET